MNDKHIEFRDPITSQGINHGKVPFIQSGRYYGFDTVLPGNTASTFKLGHATSFSVTLYNNTSLGRAVLVTPHGATALVPLTETPEIPIPVNAGVIPAFYLVYARYDMVQYPGGSRILYGLHPATYTITPTQDATIVKTDFPTFMDVAFERGAGISNGAVEIPLGYLQVNPTGANPYADISYTPLEARGFKGATNPYIFDWYTVPSLNALPNVVTEAVIKLRLRKDGVLEVAGKVKLSWAELEKLVGVSQKLIIGTVPPPFYRGVVASTVSVPLTRMASPIGALQKTNIDVTCSWGSTSGSQNLMIALEIDPDTYKLPNSGSWYSFYLQQPTASL